MLNYMALHGEQGNFATLFPNHGLGSTALRDSLRRSARSSTARTIGGALRVRQSCSSATLVGQ